MIKCLKCPYKLGMVKCTRNPCPACRESGRKNHPFPEGRLVSEQKTCAACGSLIIGGRCISCGKRILSKGGMTKRRK